MIVSAILNFVPSPYRELFELGNLVQSIMVLEGIEHMGTFYLAGWLVGTWVMWGVGLVDNLFGMLYTIVGVLCLIEKVARRFRL